MAMRKHADRDKLRREGIDVAQIMATWESRLDDPALVWEIAAKAMSAGQHDNLKRCGDQNASTRRRKARERGATAAGD